MLLTPTVTLSNYLDTNPPGYQIWLHLLGPRKSLTD